MKVRSAKAKGRNFQKQVAEDIKDAFFLLESDVRPVPASVNGVDIQLSELGKQCFPFGIECKKQESLNLWDALGQAESNAYKIGLSPLLIFSRNRAKTYATMELSTLLSIMEELHYLRKVKKNLDNNLP